MYETVSFSAHGFTAKIRLAGAQIMSLVSPDGREIIWNGNPAVWPQHSTILFPICGASKGQQVIVDGQHYPMTKHGFMKYAPFTVAKQGDDFIELVYAANEETLACYPFRFVFHVTYTLLENGYTTTFLVENQDDKPMPFCVGGHPGYVCPLEEGSSFEDYVVKFEQPENGLHALLNADALIGGYEPLDNFDDHRTVVLDYAVFDRFDTLLFSDLNSRAVEMVHKKSGHGLRVDFPKFPALALWTATGKKAPYLCIEPWIGLPDAAEATGAMEEKPYVITLESGCSSEASFTTTLI